MGRLAQTLGVMTDNERDLRQNIFAFSKAQTARPFSICMCPWEECERKAIRAHSVQNSRVLDQLQRNGHVVMPRLHTTFSTVPEFKFAEVGRNKATTFTGLCAAHDAKLFAPIETEPFDVLIGNVPQNGSRHEPVTP